MLDRRSLDSTLARPLARHVLPIALLISAVSAWGQQWNLSTPLPDPYGWQEHSLSYGAGYLYQAGGGSGDNGILDGAKVFYARVYSSGTTGGWNAASPLPMPVFAHAGVANDSFTYVLGGERYDATVGTIFVSSFVYYASIRPDGSLTAWQATTLLPEGVMFPGAAIWNNTIYVTGGWDDAAGHTSKAVYSAKIQPDGSLSSWVSQTPMPIDLYTHATVANGMLYLIGGASNNGTVISNLVYYSRINPDGTLSPWRQATSLPEGLSNFAAVAAGGRIFTMDGWTGSAVTNAVFISTVSSDGSLGAWATGPSMPDSLYLHAGAATTSYVFVSGGVDNASQQPTVYSLALPAPLPGPSLTPLVTTISIGTPSFASVYPYITDLTPISLSATDQGGPGVGQIFVSSDAAPFSPYAAPFTLSAEGRHTLQYYSVDLAGSREPIVNSTQVAVDLTPPVSQLVVVGSTATDAQGNLMITDGTPLELASMDPLSSGVASGVGTIYYVIDANPFTCGSGPPDATQPPGTCNNQAYDGAFTLPAGTHTLYYLAEDNVGNQEVLNVTSVTVQHVALQLNTGAQVLASSLNGNGTINAMTQAPNGDFYAAGCLPSAGNGLDIWVGRYSPAVELISSTTLNGDGNGDDCAWGIGVDGSGNVFASGHVFLTVGGGQVWLGKYDPTLHLISSTTYITPYGQTSTTLNRGAAVTVSPSGDVLVAGNINNDGTYSKVWVARYDNSLNLKVSTTVSNGFGPDEARAITTDASGLVYAAGVSSVWNGSPKAWAGVFDPATMTRLQNFIKSPPPYTDQSTQANAIGVTMGGQVYLTGQVFNSNLAGALWVARLDSALNLQTESSLSSTIYTGSDGLALGFFGQDLAIAGSLGRSTQSSDLLFAEFDGNLALISTATVSGVGDATRQGRSLIVEPATQQVIVAGQLGPSMWTGRFWLALLPPVTSISFGSPRFSSATLYTTNLTTYSLTATDSSGPGLAKTYFAVDSAPFSQYTAPFSVPSEGAHTIRYYSTDVANNAEIAKSTNIAVDLTAPVSSLQPQGSYIFDASGNPEVTDQTSLQIVAADPISNGVASGVFGISYWVDVNPASCTGTTPDPSQPPGTCANPAYGGAFTLSFGTHTIYHLAQDNVGNREAVKASPITVVVSGSMLELTASSTSPSASRPASGKAVVRSVSGDYFVAGCVTDPGAGLDIWLAHYNAALTLVSSATFNGSGNGDDCASALALDASGNVFAAGHTTIAGVGGEIWIGKFDQNLRAVASTYYRAPYPWATIDGNSATGIALSPSGQVDVVGNESLDGSSQRIWAGRYDSSLAFISSATIFNVGGFGGWEATGVSVDASGAVYSSGYGFLYLGSPSHEPQSATIVKLAPDLSFSTYFIRQINGQTQPPQTTQANAIALDSSGNMYIAGSLTNSGEASVPFLAKFDSSLNELGEIAPYLIPVATSVYELGEPSVYPGNSSFTGLSVSSRTLVAVGQLGVTSSASDILVAQYDLNLNLISSTTLPDSANAADLGSGLALDVANDRSILVGRYGGGPDAIVGQVALVQTPPQTSLLPGTPLFASSSTLYATNFTQFGLSAADPGGPGVARSYWSVDGAPFTTYSGPFSISAEGLHRVQYFSTDLLNHIEVAKSSAVAIDLTAPFTQAQAGVNYGRDMNGAILLSTNSSISLLAADPVSNGVAAGVAFTSFTIDQTPPQGYAAPFSLAIGTHTVSFDSTDEVGNREPVRVASFTVLSVAQSTVTIAGSVELQFGAPIQTTEQLVATNTAPGTVALQAATTQGLVLVSDLYDLGPENTNFSPAGFVTFSYDPSRLSALGISTNTLGIYDYDLVLGTWVFVGASVNPATHLISAAVSRIASLFGVLSLQPPPVTLRSLALAPPAVTLAAGSTQQFVTTGYFSDGSTRTLSAGSLSWSVDYSTVATVGATGLATAVAAGTARVSVASNSLTALSLVTVFWPDVLPPRTSLSAGAPSYGTQPIVVSTGTSIGLQATDDRHVIGDGAGGGVQQTFLAIDSSSFTVYSASFTIAAPGAHRLRYYSVDVAGNVESVKTSTVAVDVLPPRTALLAGAPSFSSSTLYVSDLTTFTLSAVDDIFAVGDDSGAVARSFLALDTTTYSVYSGTFSFGSEGLHALSFYSVDAVGNFETPRSAAAAADFTPPVTTLSISGPSATTASGTFLSTSTLLALTSFDPVSAGVASGVNAILFVVDTDPFSQSCQNVAFDPTQPAGTCANEGYAGAFTLPAGAHTVYFFADDNVDNTEVEQVSSFTVDAVPPATTLSVNGAAVSGSSAAVSPSDALSLSATDAGAGVARTYYGLDGGAFVAYVAAFSVGGGSHTLSFYSVDLVGNVENAHAVALGPKQVTAASSDGLASVASYAAGITVSAVAAGSQPAAQAAAAAQNLQFASPIYDVEPTGTQFSPAAALQIRFNSAGVNLANAAIYTYTGTSWDKSSITGQQVAVLSGASAQASGSLAHASLYAVLGPQPTNAANLVLGQADFVSSGTLTLSSAFSVAIDTSHARVYVTDPNNNRVVWWNGTSASLINGQTPAGVLGQPDFASNGFGASRTAMQTPYGVGVDASGNVYVSDAGNFRVLVFKAADVAAFAPGTAVPASYVLGEPDFTTRAQGLTMASFGQPYGFAFDASGDLYVADGGNGRVMRWTPAQIASATGGGTAVAASFSVGFRAGFRSCAIGQVCATSMGAPFGVALDWFGNLYVSDFNFSRVTVYQANQLTGSGAQSVSAAYVLGQRDFVSSSAGAGQTGFSFPTGVTVDNAGDVYVADRSNNRVMMFTAAGVQSGTGNGTAVAADKVLGQPDFTTTAAATTASGLSAPSAVTLDPSNQLFVADYSNNRALRFPAQYPLLSAPAAPTLGAPASGDLTSSSIRWSWSASATAAYYQVFSATGGALSGQLTVMSFVETGLAPNAQYAAFVQAVNAGGATNSNTITARTLAAPPTTTERFVIGENATLVIGQADLNSNSNPSAPPATASSGLNSTGLAFDAHGALWISDNSGNRVLRFSPPFSNGMSADLVLGQPDFVSWQAGLAATKLSNPGVLAFDKAGNLWVGDVGSYRVLRFTPPFSNGMAATLVLGQPDFVTGTLAGGPASTYPYGLVSDDGGNLWVSDPYSNRVVRFSPPFSNGMNASLVIGQPDFTTRTRANPPTAASITVPDGITMDAFGRLWVADQSGSRVLRYDPPFANGMSASIVLGQPDFVSQGFGSSPSAIRAPTDAKIDGSGNLWVIDGNNNRVLEFKPPFATGMSASVALGQPDMASNGAGLGPASLQSPVALAIASSGDVWVTDQGNHRVVSFPASGVPTFSAVATNSFELNWGADGNPAGVQYLPEVSPASDFSTGLIAGTWTMSLTQGFSGLTQSRYYARVRAQNADSIQTAPTALASVTMAAAPTGVSVAPSTATLTLVTAPTQVFTATGFFADGSTQTLTGAAVTWSSDAPAIATVSASGVATAVSSGTAHVIATAGAQSASAFVIVVPPTPPTTTLVVGPPSFTSPSSIFYITNVSTLGLTASGGVGVPQSYIAVDTSVFSAYAGTFGLTAEGAHTIGYYSVDQAGVTEPVHVSSVAVDLTAPVTQLQVAGASQVDGQGRVVTSSPAGLMFASQDPLSNGVASGVSQIFYSLNGASFSVYQATVSVGAGSWQVRFYGVDAVGNVEATRTATVVAVAAPGVAISSASVVLGQSSFSGTSGTHTATGLWQPQKGAFDSSGNLWIADTKNSRVVQFTPPFSNGMTPSLVLGQPDLNTFNFSLTPSAQQLPYPASLAFDAAGNLWVADNFVYRISRFPKPFSSGMAADLVFAPNVFSPVVNPFGSAADIAFDSSNALWVVDSRYDRVLKFSQPIANGMTASVVIGQPNFTSTSTTGASTLSTFYAAQGAAFDAGGNLWVADGGGRALQFVPPFTTGMSASAVVGRANPGAIPNVPNGLSYPEGLSFNNGNMWVADSGDSRVVEFVPPFGSSTTPAQVVGQSSVNGFAAAAGAAGLNGPWQTWFDPAGNLWAADAANNRVLGYQSSGLAAATPNSLTFQWTASGNAAGTTYIVQLSQDPTFATGVTQASLVDTFSNTFTGLAVNTAYYARVQAQYNGLAASAFASLGSGRTTANPPIFSAPQVSSDGAAWLSTSTVLAQASGDWARITVQDAVVGLAAGAFSARYTTDGGATWTAVGASSLTAAASGGATAPYLVTTSGLNLGQSLSLNGIEFSAQNNAGVTAKSFFTILTEAIVQSTVTIDGNPELVFTAPVAPTAQLVSTPTAPGTLAVQAATSGGLTVVSDLYDLGPDSTTFSPAATITFAYDPANLAALGISTTTLGIYDYNAALGTWTAFGGSVNAAAGTITVSIPRLSSIVALLGRRRPRDTTPPVSTLTIGAPSFVIAASTYVSSSTPLTLSAVDPNNPNGSAGSGVAVINVSLDSAPFSAYVATITLAGGAHTLAYFAVDNAGNVEATHSIALLSDSSAPVTALAVSTPAYGGGGAILSVSSTTSLPLPCNGYDLVVYNARAYTAGCPGTNVPGVYSAPLNADGTFGAWRQEANQLPYGIEGGPGMTQSGGRLYFAGGYNYVSGGTQNAVWMAPVNPDGSLGVWTRQTNSLPSAINGNSIVAWNGRLYSVGGSVNASGSTAAAYWAPINADGSVGSWTAATSLPQPLSWYGLVAANGYLLTVGGLNATGPTNAVYAAPINADGSLGAWSSQTSLPVALSNTRATAVAAGRVYLAGGAGAAGSLHQEIYSAPLGASGLSGGWRRESVGLPVPMINTELVAFNNELIAAGADSTNEAVYLLPLSAGVGGYVSAATTLSLSAVDPVVNGLASGVAFTRYRINGGAFAQSPLAFGLSGADGAYTIDYQSQDNVGNLEALNTVSVTLDQTPPVSAAAFGAPLFVGSDGTDYVTPSTPLTLSASDAGSGVDHIDVNVDNAGYTAYASTLTFAEGRHTVQFRAVDRVGNVETAHSLSIQSDATPPATTLAVSSPSYNIGGAGSGGIASVSSTTALPIACSGFGMAAYNARAYVAGCLGSNNPSVYSAPINGDGTIGAWNIEANQLPFGIEGGPGMTQYGGRLYFAGGYNYVSGGTQNAVWMAPVNADGSVGTWVRQTNSLPIAVNGNSIVAWNGRLYSVGGSLNAQGSVANVYSAPINADGSVGSWTAATSLPQPLSWVGVVAANGSIYTVGGLGSSSSQTSAVYAAVVNADGSLGAWTSQPALPLALSNTRATAFAGGRLYLSGGCDATGTCPRTIYSSVVGSNGALSAWRQESVAMPVALANHELVAWSNELIAAGGDAVGKDVFVLPLAGSTFVSGLTPFSLAAADPVVNGAASGVAFTRYRINGGTFLQSPLSFNLSGADGAYAIDYQSQDNVGNVETLKSASFTLDQTPPVSTATFGSPWSVGSDGTNYITPATPLTLSASDAGSGVDHIDVNVDNAGFTTYVATLTFAAGSHTLAFRAVDHVGNVETSHTLTLQSSAPAPTLVSISVKPAAATLTVGATQQFTAVGAYSDGSTRTLSGFGSWNYGPGLPEAIADGSGIFVNGKFYVIGGRNPAATLAYDPVAGTWTTLAAPPVTRDLAGAQAIGKVIYVFGGCLNFDCNSTTGVNWAYDTAANTWTQKAAMLTARFTAASGVLNGKIYVAGGLTPPFNEQSVLEVYDPAADAWSTQAPMPFARSQAGGAALNGKLYVVGGTDNVQGQPADARAELVAYDPISNTWASEAPLPSRQYGPGLVSLNGLLYAFGGGNADNVTYSSATWVYDPAANAWSAGQPMLDPQVFPEVAASNGQLFVAGANGAAVTNFETASVGAGGVTWSSDATAVAAVTASGLATAVSSGSAHVIASSGTISGSASVAVFIPTFVAVSADGVVTLTSSNQSETVTAVSTTTQPQAYAIATSSQGLSLIGSFYDLEPSGNVFNPPATIRFSFDPTSVDTTTIAIYTFNGVSWGTSTIANQQVTIVASTQAYVMGTLYHASLYGLFFRRPDRTPPALSLAPVSGSTVTTASPALYAVYNDTGTGVNTASVRVFLDTVDVTTHAVVTNSSATYSASGLTPGAHTLAASVADNAGNAASASSTFYVDTVSPVTTLVIGTPQFGVYVATSTPFSLTVSKPAQTFYAVDAASFTLYVVNFTISVDGAHAIRYYSVDPAGVTEAVKTSSVTVDAKPPVTQLLVDGSATSASLITVVSTDTLSVAATDAGAGVQATMYSLDGGAVQTSTAPFSLAVGTHTLAFQSRDNVGNLEALHNVAASVRPTAPPSVSVTAPVNGSTITTVSPVITAVYAAASGATIASVRLVLDGTDVTAQSVVTASSSSYHASNLAQGGHTVAVSVADNFGDAVSASSSFVIDSIPPTTTLYVDGNAASGTSIAALTVDTFSLVAVDTGTGIASTQYGLDGGPMRLYVAPFSLAAGSHTLSFQSTDVAGNVEPLKTASISITLPSLPPTVAILSPAGQGFLQEVRGAAIPMLGSVSGQALMSWRLAVAAGQNATFGFTLISSGTLAVNAAPLGTWNLANVSGWQTLRLTALNAYGQTSIVSQNVYAGDPSLLQEIDGLKLPEGVAVGPSGLIYVADTGNDRVEVYGVNGTLQLTVGGSDDGHDNGNGHGHGNGNQGLSLEAPRGVATDLYGNIYIADTGDKRAYKLSSLGSVMLSIPMPGKPVGIAVDATGYIYVSDADNAQVLKFNAAATKMLTFSLPGSKPAGIALDPYGNLYVADPKGHRVAIFSSTGALVATWSSPIVDRPYGLAVAANAVVVTDMAKDAILKLDLLGERTFFFGGRESGLGGPRGAALDSNGLLYVAERGKNRVIKIGPPAPGTNPVPVATRLSVLGQESGYVTAAQGGKLQRADQAALIVPPGSLGEDADLQISTPAVRLQQEADLQAKKLDGDGLVSVSTGVVFGPDTTALNGMVYIVVPYDPAAVAALKLQEVNAKIYWWNPDRQDWIWVPTRVDPTTHTANGQTRRLGLFKVAMRKDGT